MVCVLYVMCVPNVSNVSNIILLTLGSNFRDCGPKLFFAVLSDRAVSLIDSDRSVDSSMC